MKSYKGPRESGRRKNSLKKLFFDEAFSSSLPWMDKYDLRLGSILPRNKKQISEGLNYMSAASIRNRFLGSKKAFSEKELEYLTVLDGWNHYAIGIEELSGLKRGVAIIRLVRSSDNAHEAEVAITIIDEYQKIGLGNLLMDLIILAAIERDITRLSFTFLPQNEAIQKLVRRAGIPILGPHGADFVQIYLDVNKAKVDEIKKRISTVIPKIENY